MQFSLRTLLIGVGVVSLLMGWFVNSLRTTETEFHTSCTISFSDSRFADKASHLPDFSVVIADLAIEVLDLGPPADNHASFLLIGRGTAAQTFPGFQKTLPCTEEKLAKKLEQEMNTRLSGESQAKVIEFTLERDFDNIKFRNNREP